MLDFGVKESSVATTSSRSSTGGSSHSTYNSNDNNNNNNNNNNNSNNTNNDNKAFYLSRITYSAKLLVSCNLTSYLLNLLTDVFSKRETNCPYFEPIVLEIKNTLCNI